MPRIRYATEEELAALAKESRIKAGKSRMDAAREMGVKHPSVFHAEESAKPSFVKIRRRLIEAYSNFRVSEAVYRLEKVNRQKAS